MEAGGREGQTYAFLLDSFSTKDGSAGVSKFAASYAPPTGNDYTDGHFVSLNANSGSRTSHFGDASPWLTGTAAKQAAVTFPSA